MVETNHQLKPENLKNKRIFLWELSDSVQATCWTETNDGGFIYSFIELHSLFVDTIRSCRILMTRQKLGFDHKDYFD